MANRAERRAARAYRDAARFSADLETMTGAAVDQALAVWTDAYWTIRRELDGLVRHIAATRKAGEAVTPAWLVQQARYRNLLEVARERMTYYGLSASNVADEAQAAGLRMATGHARQLVGAAVEDAGLDVNLLTVNPGNVETMAAFMAPGTSLRRHLASTLGDDVAERLARTLTRGVAMGHSVQRMVADATERLAGAHGRMTTIIRTEALRAYRETTRRIFEANTDVVASWTWTAQLDSRSCMACVMMHGTRHPNTETLDGHPRCRCVMVPNTRSWAELGVEGVEETAPTIQTGREWFEGQAAAIQRAMLGRDKFDAWQAGDIDLDECVARTSHAIWGTMRRERSLRAIREGRDANYSTPVPA